MIFTETELSGAFLIDLEPRADERGFFARTWCAREFAEHGLSTDLAQCSISYNRLAGTLRGMHYQAPPYEEAKLVRCLRGSIYDVIVDLRPESPTYRRWLAVELTGDSGRQLYVPAGFAHGFQTLDDGSELLYLISEFYEPEAAMGVRWDDPAFGIEWPETSERLMSARDRSWPDFA